MNRKNVIAGLLLSIILVTLSGIPISRAEEPIQWSYETVENTNDVGRWTSIALSNNGNPHISYNDDTIDDLKYAKWNSSSSDWDITIVDSAGNVGRWTSIALDSNEYPHISYFDDDNDDLKYAKWTGSTWSVDTVDSTNMVGFYSTIAIDDNDYSHISYWDGTNNDLKYARWTGTDWSVETVDSNGDVGQYPSIALDNNDFPHISYYNDSIIVNELKYAKWNGTSWNVETVDSDDDVGFWTSIAIDINNNPHISYFDNTNNDLKYTKWDEAWNTEIIDSENDVGEYTSIVLDSNDYPHISYYDNTNNALKYASWSGDLWRNDTVDSSSNVGQWSSIAINNYHLGISYFDDTDDDLKYAYAKLPAAPLPPQNINASNGYSHINLSWDMPIDNGSSSITQYNIYKGTISDSEEYIGYVNEETTFYNDTYVIFGVDYFYYVTAVNSEGESNPSDKVSATPLEHIENNDNGNENSEDDNTMIINILVISSISGIIAVLLVGSSESGKYKLFYLFAPLYSKIDKSKVLNHYDRGKIYGIIKLHPGINYSSIKKVMNMGNSSAVHHLRMLERHELIKSEKDTTNRRFYTKDTPSLNIKNTAITPTQKKILDAIKKRPGISQIDLARGFQMGRQFVNYNVKILERAEIVRVEKSGRTSKCYIIPKKNAKIKKIRNV